MAAQAFRIKQFDELPTVLGTIERRATGEVLALGSGVASGVRFLMRPTGISTPVVNAYATIVNASLGQVEYQWAASQTATPGVYQAEFQVEYVDGKTLTTEGYLPVVVGDDIA